MAVGCGDEFVRIYDRRVSGTTADGSLSGSCGRGNEPMAKLCPPHLSTVDRGAKAAQRQGGIRKRATYPTHVSFSKDGRQLLASYSSDSVFLFPTPGV